MTSARWVLFRARALSAGATRLGHAPYVRGLRARGCDRGGRRGRWLDPGHSCRGLGLPGPDGHQAAGQGDESAYDGEVDPRLERNVDPEPLQLRPGQIDSLVGEPLLGGLFEGDPEDLVE